MRRATNVSAHEGSSLALNPRRTIRKPVAVATTRRTATSHRTSDRRRIADALRTPLPLALRRGGGGCRRCRSRRELHLGGNGRLLVDIQDDTVAHLHVFDAQM